jgi:hypothetical protein
VAGGAGVREIECVCATGEGGFGNVGLGMWGVGKVDGRFGDSWVLVWGGRWGGLGDLLWRERWFGGVSVGWSALC